MVAVTSRFRVLFLLLGLGVNLSAATEVGSDRAAAKSFSDQTEKCIVDIKQTLRSPLFNPPDFATFPDVTKWLDKNLPAQIKHRFASSGRGVSKSLKDWEQHGMIHGAFWNIQALRELLNAQASQFSGIANCKIEDDQGVAYGILQDQLFIVLDLRSKPVEKQLRRLGVADPYYVKMMLMYGMILDSAKVEWKDEELARVAKFQIAAQGQCR